jgi:hypothetical protein
MFSLVWENKIPTINLTNFAHFLKNSPIFLCDQIGKENLGS